MVNVNALSLVFGSDEHKSEHSDGECPGGSLDWVALYPMSWECLPALIPSAEPGFPAERV